MQAEDAEAALSELTLESTLPELAELASRTVVGVSDCKSRVARPQPIGSAAAACRRPHPHRWLQGWAALPPPLLATIFRRLLEQHTSVEEIVGAWQVSLIIKKGKAASPFTACRPWDSPLRLLLMQPCAFSRRGCHPHFIACSPAAAPPQALALVCSGWLHALRDATPLCLELTRPGHLSPAARRWLGSVPLEVRAFLLGVGKGGWQKGRGAACPTAAPCSHAEQTSLPRHNLP